MYTEFVDALRCSAAHEETWLVAAAERTEDRHIITGRLGCPVCRAEYPIINGAADFRTGQVADTREAPERARSVSEEEVLRARALLNLVEEGGTVALVGKAGDLLESLEQTTQTTYLLVNPVALPRRTDISVLLFDRGAPLAKGAIRGALVDLPVTEDVLAGLVRALRARGRLVAPVGVALPPGVQEIARDDLQWVAERVPDSSAPVVLQRRQSPA